MTGQRVGYRRVSTVDQNAARQLEGEQVDKLFTDKASGKDVRRPELQKALDYVREGDTFVVHSMDRLARNLSDLRSIVRGLTDRGVRVEFVKEIQTFTGEDNPTSDLMLNLLGAVAEFERSLIRERQAEGIALAKAKGVYRGRPGKLNEAQTAQLIKQWAAGESVTKLAKEFQISRQTVYRYISEVAAEAKIALRSERLGNKINAVSQAEQAVIEAEGMPPAVAERIDGVIDGLTGGDG